MAGDKSTERLMDFMLFFSENSDKMVGVLKIVCWHLAKRSHTENAIKLASKSVLLSLLKSFELVSVELCSKLTRIWFIVVIIRNHSSLYNVERRAKIHWNHVLWAMRYVPFSYISSSRQIISQDSNHKILIVDWHKFSWKWKSIFV